MHARDWRAEDDGSLAALYAAEHARWRTTLAWDTDATWRVVEEGRRQGTVEGAVARDEDGAAAGWCFALADGDTLQVGGLVARSEAATAALIEALASSASGRRARRWLWFGWFDAPGLESWMAARRITQIRYAYLSRSLRASGDEALARGADDCGDWRATDIELVPPLMASAYGASDAGRVFAPTGSVDQWRRYAATIVYADGCGVFDARMSVVRRAGATLDGVAMLSRIAPATAHLVQLAVRADAQSKGAGRALLAQAIARAGAAGCTALTLLVDERNTAARRLYEHHGFVERAAFLSASWPVDQPCTSSSDALPTGGVSTRR